MNKVLVAVAIVSLFSLNSEADTFTAHCRNSPPELFVEGETCIGVVPDLVNDIFTELGHDLVWIKVPWPRTIYEAKRGNVDLLIRHSMTESRKRFLDAVTYSHQKRSLSFFKSPHFKSSIKSYEDLKGLRVGALRGNFYSPGFSSFVDPNDIVEVSRTQQLVDMLKAGRIDVAVTSESHRIDLFENDFKKCAFTDTFLNPLYISIPKKSKASRIYNAVSSQVLKYRESGAINKYYEKYGVPVPAQSLPENHSTP